MDNSYIKNLAMDHFQKFVQTLNRLLVKERQKFDLIIGAGSTGVAVAKLTELIYQNLGISCPPILQIPVLRYRGEEISENLFDNIVLYPEVSAWLGSHQVNNLGNILFVDDEIYAGFLAKESMKLIIKYKQDKQTDSETTCTIVAEDQGISTDFNIPNTKTNLEMFAKGTDEVSNVITFFLPKELEQPIVGAMGATIEKHWVLNILLGLPVREKNIEGKPKFTYKFNQLAEKEIPNLHELQEKALVVTNSLINKSLF